MSYYGFPKARSKAEKLADAAKAVKKLAAKGVTSNPVKIDGMKIAKTFWGKAWCDNLEAYRDFDYRLDRGRSYVRSGCVVDLQPAGGVIRALVQGSSLYRVTITLAPMPEAGWKSLRDACFGRIDSLLALLAGKFPDEVMRLITRRPGGLFPEPGQIKLDCTCPDGAHMCKHVAAAMYGIGNRLDTAPELLFLLRGLDPAELVKEAAASSATLAAGVAQDDALTGDNLGALFGIELDEPESMPAINRAVAKAPPSGRGITAKPAPTPAPTSKSKAKPKPNGSLLASVAKVATPKGKPAKLKAPTKPKSKATPATPAKHAVKRRGKTPAKSVAKRKTT